MSSLRKDYTGVTVNNRQVLTLSHFTSHDDPMWNVRCRCGKEFKSLTQDLKRNSCRNCVNTRLRKRPYESLYNAFVGKTKKRWPVNITYVDFLSLTQVPFCHYCGTRIEWQRFQTKSLGRKLNAYNLDRKDSSLGYFLDNVVVCCPRCNFGKSNRFSYYEWKQIGNLIQSWSNNQLGQPDVQQQTNSLGRPLQIEGVYGSTPDPSVWNSSQLNLFPHGEVNNSSSQ